MDGWMDGRMDGWVGGWLAGSYQNDYFSQQTLTPNFALYHLLITSDKLTHGNPISG